MRCFQMKSLLLVVMLAAAASAAIVSQDIAEAPDAIVEYEEILYIDEAEVAAVEALSGGVEIETRRNLSVGTIGNSRLLTTRYQARGAVPNTVIVQNIVFNFPASIRIAAIRVTRMGASQNTTPSIVYGGLNRNFVTIRLQSARGRGYNYRIQIYGR
ncbi:unnamed protein product [Spodoptera exigua]|nr:unnamed protein product [Spodoptera exigua]